MINFIQFVNFQHLIFKIYTKQHDIVEFNRNAIQNYSQKSIEYHIYQSMIINKQNMNNCLIRISVKVLIRW
ncbi:hypothetical protein pb186bvf_011494 [Paramecium bursaria]